MGRYVMSNVLIIPKYKISNSLYNNALVKNNSAKNFNEFDSKMIQDSIDDLDYAGDFKISKLDTLHTRITIAPDYGTFLLLIIDNDGNAYFVLYDLNEFNILLDKRNKKKISLKQMEYLSEFKITDFKNIIGSFQGFGIDNKLNIYISSEYAPTVKSYFSHDRKIIKIGWDSADPSDWRILDMSDDTILDYENCTTEFKSIQVIDEDDLFLTVSYYKLKIDENFNRNVEQECNRVFEVKWSTEAESF